jgi:hypothetical protein
MPVNDEFHKQELGGIFTCGGAFAFAMWLCCFGVFVD